MNRNTPGTAEIANGSVSIYRPGVQASSAQSANTRPARISNPQELQTDRERNNVNRNANPQQPQQAPVRRFDNGQPEHPLNPERMQRNQVVPKENSNPVNEGETPRLNPIDKSIDNTPAEQGKLEKHQISVPQRNNNPTNNYNKPTLPVNTPPANAPQNQPIRRFKNPENPAENNRPTLPAVNNTQVNRTQQNNVPQREIQNRTDATNHQPVYRQKSNARVQNVRPAQHVTHEQPAEKPVEEKK